MRACHRPAPPPKAARGSRCWFEAKLCFAPPLRASPSPRVLCAYVVCPISFVCIMGRAHSAQVQFAVLSEAVTLHMTVDRLALVQARYRVPTEFVKRSVDICARSNERFWGGRTSLDGTGPNRPLKGGEPVPTQVSKERHCRLQVR